MHVITLFFYGEFDENGFISIQSDQDGLGRRERHPGWVQQEKFMFQLWTYDTSYKLIFYGEYNGDIFTLIWRHQDGPEGRERHPGWVQQEKTYVSIMDMWYIL